MKVVVVGGVAGGASAAARVRRLNEQAEIVVLERDDYVSFANCGLPYHIGGEIRERSALLLQTPESLKADLNLDVRTGHEVTEIDRAARCVAVVERATGRSYREPYDRLVLAQGAAPVRPRIPGVDHPRVYVLRNIPDMDAIKAAVEGNARSAVVVGGGYIGIEIAEALQHRGLSVTLVEMIDQVMPPLDHEMARDLQYHIEAHGVAVHLGTAATAVREEDGQLIVEGPNCRGSYLRAAESLPGHVGYGHRQGVRDERWRHGRVRKDSAPAAPALPQGVSAPLGSRQLLSGDGTDAGETALRAGGWQGAGRAGGRL